MIKVSGLTRYYGTHVALENVNLEIDKNIIVGFLGLNGAGKSTLLKMIAHVLPPTAGEVIIDGKNLWEGESSNSKIGYLPEEPALYRDMRVNDFLRWCAQIRGMSKNEADQTLPDIIKMCDLKGKEDSVISTLSHGYKKRVGIAQAIVHKPSILLLDEPISGLDPIQIVEMRKLLRRLKSQCTLLISSHILTEISQVCDRILVIKEGKIVADGSEEEIGRRQYRLEIVVGEDSNGIKEEIDNLDLVDSFTIISTSQYLIILKEDRPEEVIKTLVNKGVLVRTLSLDKSELERTFAKLVDTPDASDKENS